MTRSTNLTPKQKNGLRDVRQAMTKVGRLVAMLAQAKPKKEKHDDLPFQDNKDDMHEEYSRLKALIKQLLEGCKNAFQGNCTWDSLDEKFLEISHIILELDGHIDFILSTPCESQDDEVDEDAIETLKGALNALHQVPIPDSAPQ